MRNLIAALIVLLPTSLSAFGAERPGQAFDWEPWRFLPVQDGGRRKPLDTLARETLRAMCNRSSFTDPETGQEMNPTALYLTMLFQW